MPFRVHDILLVSSLYDSFTLQEDGRLNELIAGEFLEMSFQHTPGLTHVSSGEEAIALAKAESRFNLIVTALRPGGMDAVELARRVRAEGLDVPVVALAYDNTERKEFESSRGLEGIERLFLWQGDARILVAIVKSVEDARNVAHDTDTAGVPVVVVVEDNVRYYSSFLPTIYSELIGQSERLLREGFNASHKLVRMRARPKILLATNYEQAEALIDRYGRFLLGLISDVEFPRERKLSREAGFDLARHAREIAPDLPILLQSSRPEFATGAAEVGAAFLQKYSDTLLADLQHFIVENFAFGDFVFRDPDGAPVGRASNLKELEQELKRVPLESLVYHGQRNHFSRWFTARTEFSLARKLRPRTVGEFDTPADLRASLLASIAEYRQEQSETLVLDFDRESFDPSANFFTRVGGGSLGGKARGLAFVRFLLNHHGITRRFEGVRIGVPQAMVLATDVFDEFLDLNRLRSFALECTNDAYLHQRFQGARLPDHVMEDLKVFLSGVTWPLAVRSSSLLEDSQYQPFTGVYDTLMLANDSPDVDDRLRQLVAAILSVYASTFSKNAKDYLHATPFRLEQEKMAVIIQRVVGNRHDSRFYPDFSGVARSRNFYPPEPLKPEDGIAAVALGMGRTVVEGGQCLSFCPRAPRHILQFSSVDDVLANSQREFWAIEMGRPGGSTGEEAMRESRFGLDVAERDGTLYALGSTYSPENNVIYDGLSRNGVRLVTFAPVLKHGVFPLADVLDQLLGVGQHGMNRPAEIEFAARLSPREGEPHEFAFLQMRPLSLSHDGDTPDIDEDEPERLVCDSARVLGNGVVSDMRDVVVVDFHRFDRSRSVEAAAEVAKFNAELLAEKRPYLLIGVGRWGSTDPWLGIPVTWDQISGARVIIETGFRDFRVTPSQGSHFFQNLTSFQIGYFTVNHGEGFVDWDWLAAHALSQHGLVQHLRFDEPLVALMDGRRGKGVIYKPGKRRTE
ncbi:MAG: histidine kinase [Candidatus Eisenbacteria bacterium]|uniref:Histidine kinase n=1 Tax=Eiseniibacteriota bacterium TaxID=2212470 RepID=A0A933WAC8_UNCEI|nr:histidine kinase [Candidatus Eisenbacteria bacterium]